MVAGTKSYPLHREEAIARKFMGRSWLIYWSIQRLFIDLGFE